MPAPTFLPLSRQTSATVTEYRLYEYLQADVRPTFVIDLRVLGGLTQNVDSPLAFYNTSLSADNILLDIITHVLTGDLSSMNHKSDEASDFLSWVLDGSRHSMWFHDILWSGTDIDLGWWVVSGVQLAKTIPSARLTANHPSHQQFDAGQELTGTSVVYSRLAQPDSGSDELAQTMTGEAELGHSETLLSSVAEPSAHQRQIQTFDWASTELGPIATWPQALYQAVKHTLACPAASFIYWGPSRNAIFNEPGIKLLHGLSGITPGFSASVVFEAFWEDIYEPLCRELERTGRAIALSKSPGPLMERDGGLRETFWTYIYTPMLDDNGRVHGIHGLSQDVTAEVLAEGRIDTLLKVNEAMSMATNLPDFWQVVFTELEKNVADIPLAAVYSIGSDEMIDQFTGIESRPKWSESSNSNFQESTRRIQDWVREGQIGFLDEYVHIPPRMAFDSTNSFAAVFKKAMAIPKVANVLLSTEDGTLPPEFWTGCKDRGMGFECSQIVAYPLQKPSGGAIAWLVLGLNPRRTFDDEYKRFVSLLSRYIESKLVLILTLERERKTALQTMEEAAIQQQRLSSRLQQQRRELERSQSRFFKFAQQAPVGVYVLGSQGEVKFCNDAWYKIFSLKPGEVGPKAWLARTHPEDIEKVDRQWNQSLQGIVQDRFEFRVLRAGSTSYDSEDDIIYLELCDFPEIADDGNMKSVTGLVIDVSVQKAYQREQAEKLKDALEAKRAQEYFMDMVSHEMRNPLNSIIQCAEETSQLLKILKDKMGIENDSSAILEDIVDMVSTILYCGAHQKQLIDDVLTLSKLDSKLLVVYPIEVYPAALLNQVVKVFSSEIRTSKVEVLISLDNSIDGGDAASAVMIDPSRVTQILINLVSNAIKFMNGRDTRELHISLHASRERPTMEALHCMSSGREHIDPTVGTEWGLGEPIYLCFSVQDTGPGLSESEMNLLFARFQQGSPRTHVKYGGSGLGLFISRELTGLHGGEIGIMSQVDRGSTFVFYVKGRRYQPQPVALTSNTPPRPVLRDGGTVPSVHRETSESTLPAGLKPPLAQSIQSRILHVLVVEDNEVNRKVLKRQLQKLGHQVTTAKHGGEALVVLQTSTWWQGDNQQENTKVSKSSDTRPHLSIVLCDLEMPVMNGATCVRQIRQWQREGLLHDSIPVVALTGNARAETAMLGSESDFDAVISKPYSLKSLVEQILIYTERSELNTA